MPSPLGKFLDLKVIISELYTTFKLEMMVGMGIV